MGQRILVYVGEDVDVPLQASPSVDASTWTVEFKVYDPDGTVVLSFTTVAGTLDDTDAASGLFVATFTRALTSGIQAGLREGWMRRVDEGFNRVLTPRPIPVEVLWAR